MDVTVVIAALNAAPYIHHALASVLNDQALQVEVIVIDDASTDSTVEVVRAHAAADDRVRLLAQTRQQGPSAARNLGISKARGRWIAILDADDEFVSGRLAALMQAAERRGLDAIADNLTIFDFVSRQSEGLAFPPAWMDNPQPVGLQWLLERDFPGNEDHWRTIGLCKPLLRTLAVRESGVLYDVDVRMAEDLLFYCRLIASGLLFGTTDAPLYRYAVREDSLSASESPAGDRQNSVAQLVEVNRRIALLTDDGPTGRLLRQRERALWYEQFAHGLKKGRLTAVLTAIPKAGIVFIAKRVLRRVIPSLRRPPPAPGRLP